MTENEIKQDLLQVCKVKGWDSDINIVGFHTLCNKLKELGAAEEREACANLVDHILKEGGGTWGDAIRARGQA